MIKNVELKRKNSKNVIGTFKLLDLSYINKIMELQEEIINGIENKEIYACSHREEFEECINETGKIIGCLDEEDNLIAMGVYVNKGLKEGNYGNDIDITGDELLKVGQIESTVVREDYRGNGLQKIICKMLEDISLNNGDTLITATASPYNEFSVDTFLKQGYEIKKDKLKYGGLRRYILAKSLL